MCFFLPYIFRSTSMYGALFYENQVSHFIYIYIYIYIYSENKSSLPNDELPVRGSRGYVSLRKSVDRYYNDEETNS